MPGASAIFVESMVSRSSVVSALCSLQSISFVNCVRFFQNIG